MRKLWTIVGLVALVVLLGGTAFGVMALAQEEGDGTSWPFDFRQKAHDAIAGALGIGVDEYDAAVDAAREQVLEEALSEGVLTQEQAERMRERFAEGSGPRGMRGFGDRGAMMGRRGGFGAMMGGSQGSLLSVAAEELGLTVQELTAELQDGKSIAAVASEKGVEPQAIVDAFMAQRADWLAQSVAEGRITQQQADWMLEHMQEQVRAHLDAPFTGAGGRGDCFGDQSEGTWQRGPGMMRQGGFRGYPGASDS
jgi:hypothetical protein